MSKSKYPNQIDTSAELPVIKDNLTELRATIFNSYRSAIMQLEKTLGLNPQGYDGNTVAERLNMSLDEYGLLKDEAIDKLNLLRGPLKNSNIAVDAAISESKLNLDFSTNFLYNQAVVLKRFLDEIDVAINDISTKLSSHLNVNSSSSHIAKSIDIEEDVSTPQSSIALNSLEDQTLQEFASKIIFSHIKLLPSGLTEDNNSHTANQIYFSNDEIQDIISASSVQTAIEELAKIESAAIKRLVINLAKNSRLRSGKISNPESSEESRTAITPFSCSVNIAEGKSKSLIVLDSPKAELLTITNGDFLRISGYTLPEYNGDYLIEEVTRDSSGNVSSIYIYGFLPLSQTAGLSGQVLKNNIQHYNDAGLHQGIRYLKGYNNLPYIISQDPNSAKITASESKIKNITSSSMLTIEIDGSEYEIDVFDQDVYNSLGYVTLDSVINKINKYASENALLIFATYSYVKSKKELVIAHLIPNISEDLNTRSLKIKTSTLNDASENLGFLNSIDVVYYGSGSNSSFINGEIVDEYFRYKKISSGFLFNQSTSKITRQSGSFIEDGFVSGSMIFIENALEEADNGIFVIRKSEEKTLTLDHTFNGSTQFSTTIMCLNNLIDLSDFEFEDLGTSNLISTNGSILFNTFYDTYSKGVFAKKRLEIENLSKTFGTGNALSIMEISDGFIKINQTGKITVTTDLEIFLTDSNGVAGESTLITNSGKYTLFDASKERYIVVDLYMVSLASLATDYVINLYGYDATPRNVLRTGSFLYSTQLGKTIGDGENIGIPTINNFVDTGYVDEKRISESFYEKYINLPREELIGDGVVFGLDTTFVSWDSSTNILTLDLSAGICYVGGKRLEVKAKDNLTFLADGSNGYWYLFVDQYGEIRFEKEITFNSENYSSVFNQDVILLAYFYKETAASEIYDLRYFIDKSSLKLSKEIMVGPSSLNKSGTVEIGKKDYHFNSLDDAVKYCKKIKVSSGVSFTPRIILLEGYHYVSSTVYVDFDLEIYGTNNKSFITQEFSNSIVGRVHSDTDLTIRETLSTDHSLITVGGKGTYSVVNCNYFKIKNVNFDFKSNSSLLSAIYINEHFNSSEKDKLIIEGCNFVGSGYDSITPPYSTGNYFRFSIPILVTNPSSTSSTPVSADYSTLSGDYEFNRSFKNMYFYNNTFHNFKTNGYCILFQMYDSSLLGSYQIKNIVARDNLIKDCRQHTTLSKNQLFSFVKNIEDVKLVDLNHVTFTNVIEENTMVET